MDARVVPCPVDRRAELDAFLAAGFPSLGPVPASRRFPHAFGSGGLAPWGEAGGWGDAGGWGALVALDGASRIAGACVVRPFTARLAEARVRAAMIGLVLVSPELRGAELGSRLVRAAESRAQAGGAQVGVLWAARHGVYARLGWKPRDVGVVAEVDGRGGGGAAPPAPPAPEAIAVIEAIRQRTAAPDDDAAAVIEAIRQRTPAPGDDASAVIEAFGERGAVARHYGALPPPGHALEAHLDPGGRAYALVGRTPERGYVVDLEGGRDGLPAVWDSVCATHARVLVNARAGSPAHGWLVAERRLAFTPQHLALWRRFDPAAPWGWHVPWFDRI